LATPNRGSPRAARRHGDLLPWRPHRQVSPVSPPRVAARSDGRSHFGLRPYPRGHDGEGRGLLSCEDVPHLLPGHLGDAHSRGPSVLYRHRMRGGVHMLHGSLSGSRLRGAEKDLGILDCQPDRLHDAGPRYLRPE
jgi:hypothetical protein